MQLGSGHLKAESRGPPLIQFWQILPVCQGLGPLCSQQMTLFSSCANPMGEVTLEFPSYGGRKPRLREAK